MKRFKSSQEPHVHCQQGWAQQEKNGLNASTQLQRIWNLQQISKQLLLQQNNIAVFPPSSYIYMYTKCNRGKPAKVRQTDKNGMQAPNYVKKKKKNGEWKRGGGGGREEEEKPGRNVAPKGICWGCVLKQAEQTEPWGPPCHLPSP